MKIVLFLSVIFLFSGCASINMVEQNSAEAEVPQFVVKMDNETVTDRFSEAKFGTYGEIVHTTIRPVKNKKNISKIVKVVTIKKPRKLKKRKEKLTVHKERQNKLGLRYSKKLYNFWIKYFTKRSRKSFDRHLQNAWKYQKIVQEIFIEHDLPEDLFFIAMIESGYNPRIRSRASAVGYWQFMKGTAKHYGLRVDRSVDERQSIFKSTHAAARYFKDLYNIFGNWELALLAYNKGEYGVIRAIRTGNSRDYKILVKKKLLPKETIYYIPKIVAAREIYNNMKRYGLKIKATNKRFYSKYFKVKLKSNFDLRRVSKISKMSIKLIKAYNLDLKHQRIKVSRSKPYELYLPGQVKNKILSKVYGKPQKRIIKRNKKYITYKVKKGDNLTQIAKKFGHTISQIKRLNSLRSSRIYPQMRLKLFAGKVSSYTVKRGDNLSVIARKFGLSVRRLVSYNSLRSKRIYPRQRLLIPVVL